MTADAAPPDHRCPRCRRWCTPRNAYVYAAAGGPRFAVYCRRCTAVVVRGPSYRASRRKANRKFRAEHPREIRAYQDGWYRTNREVLSLLRVLRRELGRPVPIGLVREHLARGAST